MRRQFFLLCIVSLLCAGCSWIGWGKDASAPTPPPEEPAPILEETPSLLRSSRIVQPLLLERGGKLLLKPFSAGANIEATDDLDQIGLRIIRGVIDVQEGLWPTGEDKKEYDPSRFDVALEEEEKKSDFILKGRIVEVYETPGWRRWFFMKGKKSLAVEGQLMDRKTNTAVLVFKDEMTTTEREKTHKDIGQDIGRKIGQLIFKKQRD